MPRESISIVGMGYVGLATAVCFAKMGFRVSGIEVDRRRVEMLSEGIPPLNEAGLDRMLRDGIARDLLTFGDDYTVCPRTDVTFITVGTPSTATGSIDLSYVKDASKLVGQSLKGKSQYHTVVVKSTVVPGTTLGTVLPLLEEGSGKRVGKEIGLAMNPEFLFEGTAIRDTLKPDALVIGGYDRRTSTSLLRLFRKFYRKMPPTILTSPSNAELIKYSVNGFRAVQLSTINTLANLCTRVPAADMDQVAAGLALIARPDPRYLRAGMGFGGSCLGKDARALAAFAEETSASPAVFRAALEINKTQPGELVSLAKRTLPSLNGKSVAVLGLAFKAGTDDIRESVALELVRLLLEEGAVVSVFDPAAMENARAQLGDTVGYATGAKACITGADCCFLATEWEQFRRIRPLTFRKLMRGNVVVDGRRVYDAQAFRRAGMNLIKLGTWQEKAQG